MKPVFCKRKQLLMSHRTGLLCADEELLNAESTISFRFLFKQNKL